MSYSLFVSVVYYVVACFYMFFGIHAMISNAKSSTNRLFMLLMLSMSTWAFAYSFSTSLPATELSAFIRSLSVFGWGFFYSFFLHFVLILINNRLQLNKPIRIFAFYLPALINILLFSPFGYFAKMQYELVPHDFNWRTSLTVINIGQVWITLYYITYSVSAFILLIRWWKKIEPRSRLKRPVTFLLLSIIFSFLAGSATDVFPGIWASIQIPKLAIVFLILPTVFLFNTLRKSGILIERFKKAFFPPDNGIFPESRLHLFRTAAFVFTVGAVGSFFSGYFVAGGNFAREFLLALFISFFGIWLLFIPNVTKKHMPQNTLFLITSILGMTFFIMKDFNLGASTVWAIYIIFLLYTIVLDSRIHTFIFLGIALATQVVLWIIRPSVHVIIDNAQYLKRLFIIVLSFFAVRYLTNEYASKLKGYQRYAKEQEALEKISTSFISVNSENAKKKIDDMLKFSAEILNFDQAYLVEFSADYEDAVIINAHMIDGAVKSLPFRPGVKIKTATFPTAAALLNKKQPITCEDVTTIPIDDGGEERNFFASRGINSYYISPIMLENEITGMLVVEDRRKANLSARENQIYFLGIITNILGDTRKKTLYEEKLYNYAYFDETTKLANRNLLKMNLEQNLHDRKESEKLVIFNVELENLRMINDTFGHNAGEQIVIESASILKELMKEDCSISRISEERFIVVMPVVENTNQIEMCATKIIDAFSDPILPKEGIEALFVTPTIGISVYPDDGRDVDTLLKNADLAGYEAKSSDNKIVFCSSQLKSRIEENTVLTNRLFKSLDNKEFSLEFQPQISCKTGKTVGVEALLRWNYDDKKRIPADVFIPMLEQTGLIHNVGLWVLEQALQEHNRLISKGIAPIRFSVNISVVQLQKDTFVTDVLNLLAESRVEPKYIELEITESMLYENFSDTISKLSKLKEMGINIAIDDFGKGYSSLHRLELVPFNRIKIDKSILKDISLERKKLVIAEAVVSLAKALMADITVEGVENMEQLNFIRKIACDEIQGYYFSQPLSAEELEEYLKREC